MTQKVRFFHPNLPPVKFGRHRGCQCTDIRFFIVTTRSKGHVTQNVKFGGYWYCGSADLQFLNPATFRGSRSYGKKDVIFLIPVPISMFPNGQLKKSFYAASKIMSLSLFSTFLSEKSHQKYGLSQLQKLFQPESLCM